MAALPSSWKGGLFVFFLRALFFCHRVFYCFDRVFYFVGRHPRRVAANLQTRKISSGSEVSRSGSPRSAWPRLATPPYAFPELNSRPPRAIFCRPPPTHAFKNTGLGFSW
ncbi:hypothetical protein L3X38_017269 [Prunus dulcis]|uniref:Uncharacterized protein n=1 Tax=Prunus dulcis TaxID=3755 RepID=A0AAD4W700_PRUDU|nr:hypothetical protein L3X38_017269 [Prunus dulcis]